MQGKKQPTGANSIRAFLLERCLEVQALRCRWSDDARPLHLPASHAEPVGIPPLRSLAYYTSSQVDALLGDYRTASAQDTQTQAAIAGALLAYRTGPDQDVFTTNQITSALVAHCSAADQDTATASSIAAALLSYYTIAQVDGLLAGKLGVTEAASALQVAVTTEGPTRRWPP